MLQMNYVTQTLSQIVLEQYWVGWGTVMYVHVWFSVPDLSSVLWFLITQRTCHDLLRDTLALYWLPSVSPPPSLSPPPPPSFKVSPMSQRNICPHSSAGDVGGCHSAAWDACGVCQGDNRGQTLQSRCKGLASVSGQPTLVRWPCQYKAIETEPREE